MPSAAARLIITPSIPGTSPVNLIVKGAGAAEPGVNLNTRTPQPSTSFPVEDQGPSQSLFESAGCILQNSLEPQAGDKNRFDIP